MSHQRAVIILLVLVLSHCVIGMRQFITQKHALRTGLGRVSRSRLFSLSSSASRSVEPSGGVNSPTISPYRKPSVIFVLGGPGAGKGTQCEKLSTKFGMEHLSAGDLLRAEREKGSENGVLIDTLIKEGKIVPVEITVELIREAMAASKCNRFLIDGFPRNEDNVNGWEKKMGTEAVVERVIFIECAEAELERRLMHRGLTSGRSDDNLETIRKRFGTFYESTMPIIKYFENLDKVVTVQGDNTREQVFSELSEALIPYMKEEILDLNLQLLQAASSADWQTYSALCYEKITGIAPECEEAMTGLEALQASFQSEACAGISAMNEPAVHVMGISAVVSYKREFSTSDGVIRQCNESRVWQQVDGQWKNVHFHRSAIEEQ